MLMFMGAMQTVGILATTWIWAILLNFLVRSSIFLFRVQRHYGWRFLRYNGVGLFLSPPDAVGGVYYPNSAGRRMRERDERELAAEGDC